MTTRERIERGFERWGHFAYRHAPVVIALVLALVGGFATQLPKVTLDTSTEGFFRPENPVRIAYDDFRRQFGSDSLILVVIRPGEVFALDTLERVRALHEELEAEVPMLVEVTSLLNARETRAEGDTLVVGELMEEWPESPEEVADLRRRAMANPLYRDQLVSADGSLTTIVLETEVYSADATGGELGGFEESAPSDEPAAFLTGEENTAIVDAVYAVTERHRASDFEIFVTGTPIMHEDLQRAMRSDMARFTALALVAIGVLLAFAFRRTAGVVLPLVTVVLAVLLTVSVMAVIGIPITLPTQILPSFLLAVGVGGAVHIMAIFYQARRRGEDKEHAIAWALGHSGLAVVMTSLTTGGGLVSFTAAELLPIAHFGTVAPIGVLAALLLTLVLLPALVAVFPMRPEAHLEGEAPKVSQRLVVAIGGFATRRAGFVTAVWLALIGFSLVGVAQVRMSHAPYEWFPEGHRTRVAADVVNHELAGSLFVEFVLDTDRVDGVQEPALLEGLERFQAEAAKLRVGQMFVGKTVSVADVVQEIHQALNEGRPEFHAIPADPELVAQELLLFESSGTDDLEDLVDPRFTRARLTVKLPFLDAVEFAPMFEALRALADESFGRHAASSLTGLGVLAGETIEAVMTSLARSYAIAMVVICPLLVLLIGNLRMGLVAIVPNLAPIAITLGAMGWLGLPSTPSP